MTGSINQPWAISEKFANKYGTTWSNLDFIIEQNISNEQFKTDQMNVMVGSEFQLKKHEIGKLSATLDIALTTVQRGYAVGRYL